MTSYSGDHMEPSAPPSHIAGDSSSTALPEQDGRHGQDAVYDVAIVGYGPVGKLLSILLGRAGHRVCVFDRKESGYPLPRAVTHCSDFARILQLVGLSPDTAPHLTQPYDDMYIWRNRDEQSLVEVDWSGLGESGWYNTYFFHQPTMEEELDAIVGSLPNITVARGCEVTGSVETEEFVTLQIDGRPGSSSIRASWVVGADGANSAVREWAGLDVHDEGFEYDWLVVDVRPNVGVDFPHVANQLCDWTRPATMVPGGPGRRRWEFMRLPSESKEELGTEEKAWELLAPFGLSPSDAVLERHSVYTFGASWARRWRKGKTLLAGDAAHLMPPFAGQGLGAGVRDAMNLWWKLDSILSGRATSDLLDTYGPERLHHVRAFIGFSVELGKVICLTDEAEAQARDEEMIARRQSELSAPAPPRPGLGQGIHRGVDGGHLSQQGLVTPVFKDGRKEDPQEQMLDDVIAGPGALIVTDLEEAEQFDPDILGNLRRWHIAPVLLMATGLDMPSAESFVAKQFAVVEDSQGTYGRWLMELEYGKDTGAVLIRPDFHMFGSAMVGDSEVLGQEFLVAASGQAEWQNTAAEADDTLKNLSAEERTGGKQSSTV